MGEEAFLRAILATPEDHALRLVYADWLEDRGDVRAEVLRLNWDAHGIRFVDWVEKRGNLGFYLDRHPELREQLCEKESDAELVDRLAALGSVVDPGWLAFMDTLGSPFRPFFFWNNTGPRPFEPNQLPFTEQIGTRGKVITFRSAFRSASAWHPGLFADLQFLRRLRLRECYYGAASCPVHPFVCEVESTQPQITAAEVIGALKAREFRSEHIRTLNATSAPFPGYHPETENDEIHNDLAEQHIFPRPPDVWEGEEADGSDGPAGGDDTYEALREYVAGGQIWYVLLHNRTQTTIQGLGRSAWVVLFAVGLSPYSHRLVGLVSHQMCHNLCD